MSHSAHEFLAALLRNDAAGARRIARAPLDDGVTVDVLYEEVIGPALVEVGRRWQLGELTVADEHAVTALAESTIAALHPILGWPPITVRRGDRAIVTTVAGEHHVVGARMVADLLALDGWDVTFLGASTPIDAVVARAASHNAELVALSVSMGWHVQTAIATVAALREGAPRARVLVGGRALGCFVKPCAALGADDYAAHASAAVDVARRLSYSLGRR